MKKFLTMFAVAAVVFCGCSSDDDNKDGGYRVVVSNVSGVPAGYKIDGVRANMYYSGDDVVIAAAKYNNGFTIELPAEVDSRYLTDDEYVDFASPVVVSDRNAKTGEVYFTAFRDGEADNIGDFDCMYEPNDDETYYIQFVYSDRAYTAKGTYEDGSGYPVKVDLAMRKGWNTVVWHYKGYETDEWETSIHNTVPSGAKWYYGID